MKVESRNTGLFSPVPWPFPLVPPRALAKVRGHLWHVSPDLEIKAATVEEIIPGIVHSGILIRGTGARVQQGFGIDVRITHPCSYDLEIILVSPAGVKVVLQDYGTCLENNVCGNFPCDIIPRDDLARLWGEPLDGLWLLMVSAWYKESGTLDSWAIRQ